MRSLNVLLFVLFCVTICNGQVFTGLPKLKFTVEVVDEAGLPVSGANVGILLNERFSDEGFRVLTDETGRAQVEGVFSKIRGAITKTGYYKTVLSGINTDEWIPEGVKIGRRLPPVQQRYTLRPIVNPVPMYAYSYYSRLPVENAEAGFDFLRADWVGPHGLGVTNDLMIKIATYTEAEHGVKGGEITWRFPHPGDGMARVPPAEQHEYSDYRLPRYAPESGYVPAWTNSEIYVKSRRTKTTTPPGQNFKEPSYFFRIRSLRDTDGVVTNALYGKIIARGSDGISWIIRSDSSSVSFSYYVNPDGTRNMEFNPKRNLYWERVYNKNDKQGAHKGKKIDYSNFLQWP